MSEEFKNDEGEIITKSAYKKLQKEKEKAAKKKEVEERLAKEKAEREKEEAVDVSIGKYGNTDIIRSKDGDKHGKSRYTSVAEISYKHVNSNITIRARIHNTRAQTNKLLFLEFRQQYNTIQGVLAASGNVSKQMIKFLQTVPNESLVDISALVTRAPAPVMGCTVHDYELSITEAFVISVSELVPFRVDQATVPNHILAADEKMPRVNLDTRLNHRVIDLRTVTNQAIFRIQAGVQKFFRSYLDSQSFFEIHSPKMIGTASEGGANVFEVTYFKGKAFLAQSPQLYKQMVITADFDRVYEIGPVFRAENSDTYRHLTEFVGLDLEMAFYSHYHEVMLTIEAMLLSVFSGLEKEYSHEINLVREQYGGEPFKYKAGCILQFPEAIALLREDGIELEDLADLSTAHERRLGELVRAKYDTDFFILDKFPLDIRPFYTMPDPERPGYSNSYDFFMRGNEILSGAQRIHDADLLSSRAEALGVDLAGIKDYVDAFKYGAPPHAGGGIGLERVVMLFLNLPNVRMTSLFPRDPHRLHP